MTTSRAALLALLPLLAGCVPFRWGMPEDARSQAYHPVVRDVDDFACFTLSDDQRFRLYGLQLPTDPRRRLSVLEYLRSQVGRPVEPVPALDGIPPAADVCVIEAAPPGDAAGQERSAPPAETRRSLVATLVAGDPSLLSQKDLSAPGAPPALVRALREAADPSLRVAEPEPQARPVEVVSPSNRRPGRE